MGPSGFSLRVGRAGEAEIHAERGDRAGGGAGAPRDALVPGRSDVTSGVNTRRDAGESVVGERGAVGYELAEEAIREARHDADAHEDAVDGEGAPGAQRDRREHGAARFIDVERAHLIDERLDAWVCADLVDEALLATVFLSSMDEEDFGADLGEQEGPFEGGVAASDDGDVLPGVVLPPAVDGDLDAPSSELAFMLESEHSRGRSGGDNDGDGAVVLDSVVVVDFELEGVLDAVNAEDVALELRGDSALREVVFEPRDELGATHRRGSDELVDEVPDAPECAADGRLALEPEVGNSAVV